MILQGTVVEFFVIKLVMSDGNNKIWLEIVARTICMVYTAQCHTLCDHEQLWIGTGPIID